MRVMFLATVFTVLISFAIGVKSASADCAADIAALENILNSGTSTGGDKAVRTAKNLLMGATADLAAGKKKGCAKKIKRAAALAKR